MVIEALNNESLTPGADGSGSGGESLPPTANDDDNYGEGDKKARVAAAFPIFRRYGDNPGYRGVFPDEAGLDKNVYHRSDIARRTGGFVLGELRIDESSQN
jgi:hypothetical protein